MEFQHRGLTMHVAPLKHEPGYTIEAWRGGEFVGALRMSYAPTHRPNYQVDTIEVEPAHLRSGAGTALYEVAVHHACQDGYGLVSDTLRSVFSEGFWRKQARKRRAVCHRKNEAYEDNVYTPPDVEIPKGRGVPKPKSGTVWPCQRWALKPSTCGNIDLSAVPPARRRRR